MKKFQLMVVFCSLFMFAAIANATSQSLVSAGDTWEYAFKAGAFSADNYVIDHSSIDWANLSWNTGSAGFGNHIDGSRFVNPTPVTTVWPTGNMLFLQKTIDLASNIIVNELTLNVNVDNGFNFYINGHNMASRWDAGYAPGSGWEYTITLTESDLAGVWNQNGPNIIQFVALDDYDLTYFDASISAKVTATPIPAAVLLLGSGLAGIAAIRRRMA